MKTIDCDKCGGTGALPDQAEIGRKLRAMREKAGISLRRMAVLLEISPPHLVDLEHGRRNWSQEREMAFCEFCNEAMKGKKA